MKHWIRKIHLWIGLPLGILFFIIALSGALYSWAPEIATIIYKENVKSQDIPFVSVEELTETIERELPNADFRTVLYRGPSVAIQVLLYTPETYYHANINPYTGDLIHLQDMNKGWLNKLKLLHRNLLLGETGREIVHWVTLLFLVMVLSGIVLWWPSNYSRLKKRFRINLSARLKVLNYEFHNVIGFYASWILIFVIATGLFWGFEMVKNSFRLLGQENSIKYDIPMSTGNKITHIENHYQLLDQLGSRFRKEFPNNNIRVSNPHKSNDPIQVSIIDKNQLVYNVDHLYFDRYTGERLSGNFEHGLQAQASTYTKLRGLVYDVHFGSILGLTGRLMVFFASLIGASLPFTGFYIWWCKRKKL